MSNIISIKSKQVGTNFQLVNKTAFDSHFPVSGWLCSRIYFLYFFMPFNRYEFCKSASPDLKTVKYKPFDQIAFRTYIKLL